MHRNSMRSRMFQPGFLAALVLGAMFLLASPARSDEPLDPDKKAVVEKVIREMVQKNARKLKADANDFDEESAEDVDPNEVIGKDQKEEDPKDQAKAVEEAKTLEDCHKLYMSGRYSSAAKAYRKLMDEKSLQVSAAIGVADALSMQGKYTDAIKTLESVKDAGIARAKWNVAMADALTHVGRYEDALKHASRAHELKPTWAPTVLAHGRLLETLGREQEAIKVYKSMSEVIDEGKYGDDPRSLVAMGKILDREAILLGRRASEQAMNILHNYFQEAYQKVDKKYWPANIASGMLLLSKHRPKTAMKEFALAAKLNKRIPDAYVGAGLVQLSSWQFEKCLAAADKALKINPNHADALLIRGICYMQWRKFEKVPPITDKILKVNPNHLDALSLAAAAHLRMGDEKKAQEYIDRVHEINETYAGLPTTIGQWMAAGRQFDQAEKYYKQAIALNPKLAEPLAGLGLTYMQTGDERKAREALIKAHELDDFRIDVVNYLRILDVMDDFLVKETEHFIVKVAPRDAVLLEQVAEFMEEIHEDICGDFGYEPQRKTVIEIMPTHKQFSLRISGKGWIGTVGACTGRVIALAAPNPKESFGTHNWATVLRHEYTHTVTLAATNNRIPHWFTEACAVWEQPDRRNYRAVGLLVSAVRNNHLFPMDELDWGFIRPKKRTDRSQAYAQSEWAMEYIIEKRGFGTIAKMLEGFRDGMTQEEVFEKIVGIPEKQFDKKFKEWAHQEVREWGFDPDPPPNMTKAAQVAKKDPNSAEAQANYAVSLYQHRQLPRAVKAANKALELDPNNAKALAVLASVSLAKKEYDKAIEHAEKLDEINDESVTAAKVLSKSYLAKREWMRAIVALEKLQTRQPLDPWSYEQLAKLYNQFGRPDDAVRNLSELHRRTMKDPKYARQIAEIYRSMDKSEMALEYFRQIAHINPYELSSYQAQAEIHYWAGEYDKAIDAVQKMVLLQPKNPQGWMYMAKVRFSYGRETKDREQLAAAREAAERAVDLDPSSPAKALLEAIEQAMKSLDASQASKEAA